MAKKNISLDAKHEQNKAIRDQLSAMAKDRRGHDAVLFVARVSDDGKYSGITSLAHGSEKSLIQAIINGLDHKGVPNAVKKALFIAVANMLMAFDAEAKDIGHDLGLWTEDKFGEVDCDCPKCQEKKKALLN